MENSLQNDCEVLFKTVTKDKTSIILQCQPLKLVTLVIVINVVIGGFKERT